MRRLVNNRRGINTSSTFKLHNKDCLFILGEFVLHDTVTSSVLRGCWERQYASSHSMLEALKDIFFLTTVDLNVAISLQHVKSANNPADALSRRLSLVDFALASRIWSIVQKVFVGPGGHTCDLMAQDSNAQRNDGGIPLPHIAPVSTLQAMGVNLFTQDIAPVKDLVFESCYVFPPFRLIGPVLKFLREQKARCTIVVPDRYPRPYWWPQSSHQSPRSNCA